ncbi:MAG: hypothetical protein JSS02_18810, partial [Planctomycetes bacterium]|nr:hypothetical protein [Planctomycetota bacterium]
KISRAAITLSLLAVASLVWAAEEKPGAAKTKSVTAGDVKLTIPETWKQKPKSAGGMRTAEFEVPPVEGDKESGEYVVFFFGKGGAGGVQANVERWIGQVDKEGRKVKIVTGESPNGKYTLVDLSGTYSKTIGPPVAGQKKTLPGWRVINVAVETEGGPYYLKLDGPAKTITAVEAEFRASFGGKKDTEKEQKAE